MLRLRPRGKDSCPLSSLGYSAWKSRNNGTTTFTVPKDILGIFSPFAQAWMSNIFVPAGYCSLITMARQPCAEGTGMPTLIPLINEAINGRHASGSANPLLCDSAKERSLLHL